MTDIVDFFTGVDRVRDRIAYYRAIGGYRPEPRDVLTDVISVGVKYVGVGLAMASVSVAGDSPSLAGGLLIPSGLFYLGDFVSHTDVGDHVRGSLQASSRKMQEFQQALVGKYPHGGPRYDEAFDRMAAYHDAARSLALDGFPTAARGMYRHFDRFLDNMMATLVADSRGRSSDSQAT